MCALVTGVQTCSLPILRLASRLQTLRWHAESKTPCAPAFAQETLDLYAPLANRLGIWQIKWEMEDLAFRFLEPDRYKQIARLLEEKRVEREAFIAGAIERSEEHTSELQSLMRISYAVFCLKKKTNTT